MINLALGSCCSKIHLQCGRLRASHLPGTVRYASLTGAINRGVRKSQHARFGGETSSFRRDPRSSADTRRSGGRGGFDAPMRSRDSADRGRSIPRQRTPWPGTRMADDDGAYRPRRSPLDRFPERPSRMRGEYAREGTDRYSSSAAPDRRPSRFQNDADSRPSRYQSDADSRPSRFGSDRASGRAEDDSFQGSARRKPRYETTDGRYDRPRPEYRNNMRSTPSERWQPRDGGSENRTRSTNEPFESRHHETRYRSQQDRALESESIDGPRHGRGSTRNGFQSSTPGEESTEVSRRDKNIPLPIPYTTPASEFLYGTSVVRAALASSMARKRKLYKFYVYQGQQGDDRKSQLRDAQLERLARQADVPIIRVSGDFLKVMDKMSGGRPHNGYILEASPLPRRSIKGLGEVEAVDGQCGCHLIPDVETKEESDINGKETWIPLRTLPDRQPFVLLLEGIEDPGNLGGIIRTAAFLGVSAVVVSKHGSATFTPVALKAAAGACEDMLLFVVSRPGDFVEKSKAAGWKVFAANAPRSRNERTSDHQSEASAGQAAQEMLTTDTIADPLSTSPCILMLGSEGAGLSRSLNARADHEVCIAKGEGSPLTNSLNVSVAAGILCVAFVRQSPPAAVQAAADGDEMAELATVVPPDVDEPENSGSEGSAAGSSPESSAVEESPESERIFTI